MAHLPRISRRSLVAAILLLLSNTGSIVNAQQDQREPSSPSSSSSSSSAIIARQIQCEAHEELCPITKGANQWHCVDVTDPKTCGGCPAFDSGFDCTSIRGVFMQECTNRGQCTGCRWKRGGMKPSLLEPDYLSCSVISSHPPKKSRTHVKRGPQLTFARLVEKANAKPKPMAAMKPGDAYPMDTSVDEKRSREGNPAVHRDPLDFDDPALLPSPPPWLIAFITANQATLPVETDDSELLWWFESYKKPLVRISTLKENAFDMSVDGHGQSRRKTNADRLKLGLPPLAPKDLNRPNKPAPWKLGVQLGLVDPAEGETRGDGTYRNNVLQPPQSERQRIWSEIVQAAIRYSEKKEQSKVPVVEALWDLIDYVTTGASHKGKWPMSPFKHPEAANPPPARNPKEKLQLEDSPAGKILRPVMPAAQLQEVDIKPIMPKKEVSDVRAAGQAARKAAANLRLTRPQQPEKEKAAGAGDKAGQEGRAQLPIQGRKPAVEPAKAETGVNGEVAKGRAIPGRRPAPNLRAAKAVKIIEDDHTHDHKEDGTSSGGGGGNAFEDHLRVANLENARAKAIAEGLVQPENELLKVYAKEGKKVIGGDEGRKQQQQKKGPARPLMANMAKARPNAHKVPQLVRNADRGKKRQ